MPVKNNIAAPVAALPVVVVGGPTGPLGGPTGLTGPTGSFGTGPTGPEGPTGVIGATGIAGATGIGNVTGPRGETGPRGAPGGIPGPTGITGPVGAAVYPGVTGPTGPATGSTGPAGVGPSWGMSGGTGAPVGGGIAASQVVSFASAGPYEPYLGGPSALGLGIHLTTQASGFVRVEFAGMIRPEGVAGLDFHSTVQACYGTGSAPLWGETVAVGTPIGVRQESRAIDDLRYSAWHIVVFLQLAPATTYWFDLLMMKTNYGSHLGPWVSQIYDVQAVIMELS